MYHAVRHNARQRFGVQVNENLQLLARLAAIGLVTGFSANAQAGRFGREHRKAHRGTPGIDGQYSHRLLSHHSKITGSLCARLCSKPWRRAGDLFATGEQSFARQHRVVDVAAIEKIEHLTGHYHVDGDGARCGVRRPAAGSVDLTRATSSPAQAAAPFRLPRPLWRHA